jgi:hypothetical protein
MHRIKRNDSDFWFEDYFEGHVRYEVPVGDSDYNLTCEKCESYIGYIYNINNCTEEYMMIPRANLYEPPIKTFETLLDSYFD